LTGIQSADPAQDRHSVGASSTEDRTQRRRIIGATTASTAPKSSNATIGIVLIVLAIAAVLVYAGVHAVTANSVVTKQTGATSTDNSAHTSMTIERHHAALPWVPLAQHPAVGN
jgi:hypothetical protein